MANARISELAPIVANQLTSQDLLLVSDVTAYESKKLTFGDLSTYILSGGAVSGSFYGTASWAKNSVSTSYAPYQPSSSYALTASYVTNGVTPGGSYNITTSFSSGSLTSSYSTTASYVNSSSFSNTTLTANLANSTSYLIYNAGANNGTASYSVNTLTASYTLTGGGVVSGGSYNITTSYASSSLSSSYITASNVFGIVVSASHANYADVALVGITTNIQSTASYASSSLSSSYSTYARFY